MNNLILGGAGFIGKHLAHRLLRTRMERVTIVDNLATGAIDLSEFAEYKNLFSFIQADLSTMEHDDLVKLIKDHHRVFHLAGSVGVQYCDKNPHTTFMNNIAMINKLVPAFAAAKRHVIFSSTSEIYGDGPFGEEDSPKLGPSSKTRWAYATSKLATEFAIRSSTFPYTIVRFFNVVGPGQLPDYGMVLPRFVEAAKKGDDVQVYGPGTQVRSFCHVADAIEAVIKVMDINGELFNIGNDTPMTIQQLAERVVAVSGSTSKIVNIPYEEAYSSRYVDIHYRVPDNSKLKAITGYMPKYDIDDIIRDML